MSTSNNLPDEKILYVLLNKIKHNEGQQEVSFFTEDFKEREVSRDILIDHLDHLIKSDYIKAEIASDANANQGSNSSLLWSPAGKQNSRQKVEMP